MTYWQKDWNLYVCRYVITQKVIDHTDKGSFTIQDTHYIKIDIFKSDNPEEAYEYALAEISGLDYGYRNDEGQEVRDVCVGINELDLLQTNISSLENTVKNSESYTIETISEEEMNKKPKELVRKKEELKLFDRYYNYKSE